MWFKRFFLALVSATALSKGVGAALQIDNAFDFGTLAVTSNASVSSVQMFRSGKTSSSGYVHILQFGQPGVYTLNGFPPFTLVSMSADLPAYSVSPIPNTQQFIISALDMVDTLQLDGSGSGQFKLGGVLQTSGLGGTYVGPATYQISLNITITY